MSYNIAPAFRHLPDPQVAEAFSEILLNPGAFKVDTRADSLGSNEMFPPEPSYLSAICAAYIEKTQEGTGVRRQFILMEGKSIFENRQNTGLIFNKEYKDRIEPLHEFADNLLNNNILNIGNLAVRAVELSIEKRLRTVAAFALFKSASTGQPYSALMIPKSTYSEIPLEFREEVIDVMNFCKKQGFSLSSESENTKKTLQKILQQDASTAKLAFLAAARHLPDLGTAIEAIDAALNETHSQFPRKNRQERRLREREQQRRNRKNF